MFVFVQESPNSLLPPPQRWIGRAGGAGGRAEGARRSRLCGRRRAGGGAIEPSEGSVGRGLHPPGGTQESRSSGRLCEHTHRRQHRRLKDGAQAEEGAAAAAAARSRACCAAFFPPARSLTRRQLPPIGSRAQGKLGNAAQYVTRNQAIKKLQLKLSEFRRASAARESQPPQAPPAAAPPPRPPARPARSGPDAPLPALQAAVHPQGHPPARAEEEGARRQQDVLPRQGHQLAAARAAARHLQARAVPLRRAGAAAAAIRARGGRAAAAAPRPAPAPRRAAAGRCGA